MPEVNISRKNNELLETLQNHKDSYVIKHLDLQLIYRFSIFVVLFAFGSPNYEY